MADLTADINDKRQDGKLIDVPYGSNTIYAGALVCVDSAGKAVKADNAKPFLGVAMEGSAVAKDEGRDYIRVWVEGTFEFNLDSAAATDLGAHVKIGADDNTVAKATFGGASPDTVDKVIGKIVDATDYANEKVRVKLGL